MGNVVVGIDFGSSRIKAAAYDRDGTCVRISSVPTPVKHVEGGTDFPVLQMLRDAVWAVRRLELEPLSIEGVGITSMGEVGTVLRSGELADLEFPSWYDNRGAQVALDLERSWGRTWLRRHTGWHCRTTSTVAKLASVDCVPDGTFLGVAGAMAWLLSASTSQESALAASSGVFDVVGRFYLEEVWQSAGLSQVKLPGVRPAGFWAPACTELASDLGLVEGAPVMIAGHDHVVASLGAGASAGELVDSMGTGEAIIAIMQSERAEDPDCVYSVPERDPFLSVEMWPTTGAPLVVWERMRPGLAMTSFLRSTELPRNVLDKTSNHPGQSPLIDDWVSLALEQGERPKIVYNSESWGQLIDYYTRLAIQGEHLVRGVTGAVGTTVLTGGGLRSSRWAASKAALATQPFDVSLVKETATRGSAAMVGAAVGWWGEAAGMPGATRVTIAPGDTVRMLEVTEALRD